MRIHALTVCVNYAAELAVSIDRWRPGLASWTVVTDHDDQHTAELCKAYDVTCCKTDAFYRFDAVFNKGAALEETRRFIWPDIDGDWLLLLDADVVPPEGWGESLKDASCKPGHLYGARRYQLPPTFNADVDMTLRPKQRIDGDGPAVGFFQLFHTTDPVVQMKLIRDGELIETCWRHAGVYDSHLMHLWTPRNVQRLPLALGHLGERDNWWGKGNRLDFNRMMVERARRGGYDHERVTETI